MKVSEIFASIQGEGRYVGRPQVFVRLTRCNLRCRWCDTRYAWEGGKEKTVAQVLRTVEGFGLRSVCITGGEPMLQVKELRLLVSALKRRGYEVVLETNGTLYDRLVFSRADCVSMDMKPPSSGEKSDWKILGRLRLKDQVKVVIADEKDYRFAKRVLKKSRSEVVLQPSGGVKVKALAKKVLQDRLGVRVLPQLHKVVGVR